MRNFRTVAAITFCLSTLACSTEAELQRDVDALVKQLGSNSFGERQSAEKKLLALSDSAAACMETHLKSPDADLVLRLTRIHCVLLARTAEMEAFETFGQLKKDREISSFVIHVPGKEPKGEEYDSNELTLRWIAYHQHRDGYWESLEHGADRQADLEQTALAVLLLLGVGHTEHVGEYSDCVRRGTKWLMSHQRADGAFVAAGTVVDGLQHAVVSYAISEAAAKSLAAPAAKADIQKQFLESAQLALNYSATFQSVVEGKRSGFGRTEKSERPDILTTAFFILQFKSASAAKLKVPEECSQGLAAFMNSLDHKERRLFRTSPGGRTSCLATFVGCLYRSLNGAAPADVAPYFDSALRHYTGFSDGPAPDVLTNYFASLAAFHIGGKSWKVWSERVLALFPFRWMDTEQCGSWDPAGVRVGIGRVGTTALAGLTITTYYQYLWREILP